MKSIKKKSLIDCRELKTFLRDEFSEASAIKIDNISVKGESAIGRIDLKLDNAKRQRLWLKIDKSFFSDKEKGRQIAQESYKILEKLHDSFSDSDNLAVVKPLRYVFKWAAHITEDVPGISLSKIIYRYIFSLNKFSFTKEKTVRDILSNCGEWIAKLQEVSVLGRELRGHELDSLKEDGIKRDLSFLNHTGVSNKAIKVLGDYLFEHSPSIRGLTQKGVGCHIDFSPRNIIVGKNSKITLLDFENFSYRWLYDNVAIFMVYLESMRKYFLVDENKLNNLKRYFLEGYQKRSRFKIDERIFHFFQVRYMTLMVANEFSFVKKRSRIMRRIILKRMIYLLEHWVDKNISLDKQGTGGYCARS